MRRPKPTETELEVICPACDGTGFPAVEQPPQPSRKIYPPPCKQCSGKGRLARVFK